MKKTFLHLQVVYIGFCANAGVLSNEGFVNKYQVDENYLKSFTVDSYSSYS